MPDAAIAERIQRARDLKSQIDELKSEDDKEIVFKDTSPRQKTTLVYSMADGEPIEMPIDLAQKALGKQLSDGTFMFTGKKEEAPEYAYGSVKCFLHAESIERTSGLLAEAGLGGRPPCPSAHLASKFAMEEVARSKHRKEWQALQAFKAEQKETLRDDQQRQQLDATLALAARAAGVEKAVEQCPSCEYTGTKQQVTGHKAAKHRGDANAETQ